MRINSLAVLSTSIAATTLGQTTQWPVTDPLITHDYAEYNQVNNNKKYHTGPDLVSQSGDTTVRAFADGVVEDRGEPCLPCNTICGGCERCPENCSTQTPEPDCDCFCGPHNFGNYVIIHHEALGVYSLYAHLNQVWIAKDDPVVAGDPIGEMGSTGYSCGKHLHFEVRNFEGTCSPLPADSCGYSIDVPDGEGYLDPRMFILPPFQETSITPVVVEVIGSIDLNVRAGPGTAGSPSPDAYAVLTRLPVGHQFVAYRVHGSSNDHWYRIDLPNAAGPVHGWAAECPSSLKLVPSGRVGQVVGTGTGGATIHEMPGSGTFVRTLGGQEQEKENIRIWDGQRVAIVEEQSESGEIWYQIDLPLSAESQRGWVSRDFIQITEQGGCSWVSLPGLSSSIVSDSVVFDDGSGDALFVGGGITTAGCVSANNIARWDGTSWSPLGMGTGFTAVGPLAVFEDGGGPALCAVGTFNPGSDTRGVAKWNGTGWSALGANMNNSIYVITAFDDDDGPGLYAGGRFTTAGGVSANHIAKWDGAGWSPLGAGVNNTVSAIADFDDGTGPALYAGGWFTTAGGVSANNIARWDGTSWSPLGTGMNSLVSAFAVFDDGTGPALYAGGWFTTAGGVSANNIARWDGTSWSPLGTGMNSPVLALSVFDDGAGPALYAGGYFTTAGGLSANRIARWNGSSWSALGTGTNGDVFTLAGLNDGGGPALYAAGYFNSAGSVTVCNIAKWYCFPPTCGDNQVNQPHEHCDGTDDSACPGGCEPDCRCFSCSPDADGDGVTDPLDPNPDTFGGSFEDLTNGVAGTIADRGNQELCVTDVPAPGGARICSLWASGPSNPAQVTAYCLPSFFKIRTLQTDNCVELICGNSVTATAIAGDVAGELEIENGISAGSLMLSEGNAITFDGDTLQVSASSSNTTPLLITENSGNQVSLAPGASETLAIEFGTSRYIALAPSVNFPGTLGIDASIQVRVVDIDDALGQDSVEGQIWWAGASQSINNAPNGSLSCAPLICEAAPSNAQSWPAGMLHLFGAPVVPGSTYEVRMCDASGANCSDPLTVATGKWGDIVADFGGSNQPNFGDITAIVDKFKTLASAPDMIWTDLLSSGGQAVDAQANFADISADVDAFKGTAYPYPIPACP